MIKRNIENCNINNLPEIKSLIEMYFFFFFFFFFFILFFFFFFNKFVNLIIFHLINYLIDILILNI